MPTALQSSKPWQVLILMELNHLLVHCDLQAMLDESWGVSMDFDDGYRMYIRPGAIDVLRSVLDEAQKSCTLGIFTGMSSDLALQMVKELLKQTIVEKKQDEWQVMHHGNELVSLFNKDLKLRVFLFHRSEHEAIDSRVETSMEEDSGKQFRSLHDDFFQAISIANSQGNCFSKENTVLVAFEKERNLLSENVFCVDKWMFQENGSYMQELRNQLTVLFYEQPDNVISWLQSRVKDCVFTWNCKDAY